MNDDEFMASYRQLIKGAVDRHDQAEMQQIGTRMGQVMLRRSGMKP